MWGEALSQQSLSTYVLFRHGGNATAVVPLLVGARYRIPRVHSKTLSASHTMQRTLAACIRPRIYPSSAERVVEFLMAGCGHWFPAYLAMVAQFECHSGSQIAWQWVEVIRVVEVFLRVNSLRTI